MKIGKKEFDLENHCYVMGILNVNPDSFSDGGKWNRIDAAQKHTGEMIRDGAAIIDIGGESTRPGYQKISDEEEISRVVPMIEMVKKEFDVPVSIDTYKSGVAEAALQAGADMVNDIWGLKADDKLAGIIAKYDAPCCLMHNRNNTDYQDFRKELLDDLRETIAIAKKAGIKDQKIILDPGVGFGKTYEQNLMAIHFMTMENRLSDSFEARKSAVGSDLDSSASERENHGDDGLRRDGGSFLRPGSRREREFPGRSDDRGHSP